MVSALMATRMRACVIRDGSRAGTRREASALSRRSRRGASSKGANCSCTFRPCNPMARCPTSGERVSYQLGTGKDDKPRAVQVFFPDRPLSLADGFNPPSASPRLGRETSTRSPQPASSRPGSRPRPAYRHKSSWRGKVIPLLLVGLFSLYSLFSTDSVVPLPVSAFIGDEGSASRSTPQTSAFSYQCDGREYCSQMTSCEEATWFLRHCPNTKMDGEGDGVPCERQWCGH